MTSFCCSYFVKGRIFSPFFFLLFWYFWKYSCCRFGAFFFFFFCLFPPSFVLIRSEKKVASINFLKRTFVWLWLWNQRKLCARKSHNSIHTCDQHVTFSFPIICEPSNVGLWKKRRQARDPEGNAKVECNFQVEITSTNAHTPVPKQAILILWGKLHVWGERKRANNPFVLGRVTGIFRFGSASQIL